MTPRAQDCDIVVIGCGPAGSTAAKQLCDLGYSVIGIEKEVFPRYHIGESLTGSVARYLEAEGLAPELEQHDFPVKYGVKVIGNNARNEFFVGSAPGPAWQVRRDEFDQLLLQHAIRNGMSHQRGRVINCLDDNGRVGGVRIENVDGSQQDIHARCVVDATGGRCFLSSQQLAGERVEQEFGGQVAVYTQMRDCERDPGLMFDNTILFYNEEKYHWAWFIPLSKDIVSVGIVVSSETYKSKRKQYAGSARPVADTVMDWGLRNINPDLWQRCGGREWTTPVGVIRDYSYDVRPFAGEGWVCVGDSHRFIDPIFSFGVSIAITEAQMAAEAIHKSLQGNEFSGPFREYQRQCDIGQNAAQDVMRYFWDFPAFFGVQARGKHREGIIRLLAGGVYDEPPLPALTMMRESMTRLAETG